MYNGTELTAVIKETFQRNEMVKTNERSKYSGKKAILVRYKINVATSATIIYLCQVVISRATISSSVKINEVNEIETIFRNSFSNKIKLEIMITPP